MARLEIPTQSGATIAAIKKMVILLVKSSVSDYDAVLQKLVSMGNDRALCVSSIDEMIIAGELVKKDEPRASGVKNERK